MAIQLRMHGKKVTESGLWGSFLAFYYTHESG